MTVKERWAPFSKAIPDTKTILAASIANLRIGSLPKAEARTKFGDNLLLLMEEGLRLLRGYQDQQRKQFLLSALSTELPALPSAIERELVTGGAPRDLAIRIVGTVGAEVAAMSGEFFSLPQKSIDQQTKKRAGVHMERAMAFLFEKAELPFQQQRPKKSDFVFPDGDTWESTPELAALVSAKHTLAERWKQLMGERHETGRNAYLATLDTLAQDKATKLTKHGFTLYVLPQVLNSLQPSPRIRDLNELPSMIAQVINCS
ncbi:MAG TPA: type II restriction endonuclease [Longimicrobiales bacterium]|nr:type II restriction endonuclease [Longimicrobiales bacterium]